MKKENENEKLKNEYEETIVKYIIEQNEELSIEEIEEELNCGISLIKRVKVTGVVFLQLAMVIPSPAIDLI